MGRRAQVPCGEVASMAERQKRRSHARAKSLRRARRRRIGRLFPVLVLVAVAYFYYRPLASWVHTRSALARRESQVATLRRQKAELEQAVARATSLPALTRRARRIGLVQPGEQLFIVKGIPAWKRTHQGTK